MLIANLMFENVSATHCSFLISASETSLGPAKTSLVHWLNVSGFAGFDQRCADVAVEGRADAVVAVEVDAPRGPRQRVLEGLRQAVVDHVAALVVVVVERVVAAVRVDRRDDEDVEVVDQFLRLRVDRVVAQQPLRRLQAGDRGDPLTRVLLAVDEDADLRPAAILADPQHLHLERRRAGRGRAR